MEDSTTQNVLAAFVGLFLYSLVAIITLAMGTYGECGRVVLFVVTLLVVLLICRDPAPLDRLPDAAWPRGRNHYACRASGYPRDVRPVRESRSRRKATTSSRD